MRDAGDAVNDEIDVDVDDDVNDDEEFIALNNSSVIRVLGIPCSVAGPITISAVRHANRVQIG